MRNLLVVAVGLAFVVAGCAEEPQPRDARKPPPEALEFDLELCSFWQGYPPNYLYWIDGCPETVASWDLSRDASQGVTVPVNSTGLTLAFELSSLSAGLLEVRLEAGGRTYNMTFKGAISEKGQWTPLPSGGPLEQSYDFRFSLCNITSARVIVDQEGLQIGNVTLLAHPFESPVVNGKPLLATQATCNGKWNEDTIVSLP